jgi:hypothetical protein
MALMECGETTTLINGKAYISDLTLPLEECPVTSNNLLLSIQRSFTLRSCHRCDSWREIYFRMRLIGSVWISFKAQMLVPIGLEWAGRDPAIQAFGMSQYTKGSDAIDRHSKMLNLSQKS